MDYEKKYKEALERAKRFMSVRGVSPDEDAFECAKILSETIFPELAESEGERIRNLIYCLIRDRNDNGKILEANGCSVKEALAWLDKQGMPKPAEWHREDEQNLNACLGYIRDEFLRRWLTDIIHVKYDKPTDKVEQKFKVGDWVVTSYGKVNQVVSVDKDSDGYTLDDGVYFSGSWCDMYHLWTIQDAKPGDVLYSIDSKQPFIYKERPQFSQAKGYCCINKFGEFAIWNTSKCVICTDKYIPATKEQRDTLMKAMTDAGYTFDFEKKELKKIEQKRSISILHIGQIIKHY